MRLRSTHEIATEIRLKRQVHVTSAFALLEGREDRLFLSRFLDGRRCRLEAVDGKENVLTVVDLLEKQGIFGVLGLVDLDFDALEGAVPLRRNILTSDCHDVETMLFRSAALGRVLRELGSEAKIRTFEYLTKKSIRESVTQAAAPVGYLRWYSLRNGLNLRFEALNFSRFIDPKSLELDPVSLVQTVKNNSMRPELNSADLTSGFQSLKDTNHNPWHVCNGHDLVEVLALGLRGVLGSQDASTVSARALRRALRLAFEAKEFDGTEVARGLRRWQTENPPFRIM